MAVIFAELAAGIFNSATPVGEHPEKRALDGQKTSTRSVQAV
jgi:hypothetical protein